VLARAAIQPLLQREAPTVVAETEAGRALEECPTEPPSLILNGWVYALWGLRDVALGLQLEPAQALLDESVSCLATMLPRYDVGWWTRYSLYPHRLPDLAKLYYHRLHIVQAEVLGALTGNALFQSTADRWRAYDTWHHRVALVAQKIRFVGSGYR
jgi:hypothetical protein